MGGSATAPSVSDDGCYVAFESSADLMLYDCSTDSAVSVAQGSHPSVSGNGRYVAFSSSAALVTADTNGKDDVYRYDRVEKTFSLVSIGYDSSPGDDHSFSPSISSTGRYVAFESWAANITPGDTNNSGDIFVRDMEQPVVTNTLVSMAEGGGQGYFYSRNPSISAAGDRVAFHSLSSNLVAGDTNGVEDVFLRDITNGHTYRVSVDASGVEGNGASGTPAISGDGRYIAFSSEASNLVDGDSNGFMDVFLKDYSTGTVRLVSVNASGGSANGVSGCSDASMSIGCLGISGTGRFVAFPSAAGDLVSGDTNGDEDVFLRDTQSSVTRRVSLDFAGAQESGESNICTLSSTGRFVAFDSTAPLVGNHYESDLDVFLVDRGGDTPDQDLFPVVEDFSDGASSGDADWSVKKGRWQVNSAKQYVSASGRENVSLIKILAAKPYQFTAGQIDAEVKLDRTSNRIVPNAGLIFAWQSSTKYRFVELRSGLVRYGQVGNFGGVRAFSRSKRAGIRPRTPKNVSVSMTAGGTLQIYLDGRRVTSYKFRSAAAGAVGLYSRMSRAWFDNVHVQDESVLE